MPNSSVMLETGQGLAVLNTKEATLSMFAKNSHLVCMNFKILDDQKQDILPLNKLYSTLNLGDYANDGQIEIKTDTEIVFSIYLEATKQYTNIVYKSLKIFICNNEQLSDLSDQLRMVAGNNGYQDVLTAEDALLFVKNTTSDCMRYEVFT